MAVVDAELNYNRARLDETSFADSGGFTTLDSNGPFISYGSRQLPGRGYGRGGRGRGVFDPWTFPQARPIVLFPSEGGYGSSYELTYERSALITRFNELAARRAGLTARWRELEEEARRAGASPGWLRP
ncbi:MAG: hypothetical protein M3Y84_02800 [Acidobacteriota bacterium]|nr:hypothetical protein [Acidobacteriota bacterium]